MLGSAQGMPDNSNGLWEDLIVSILAVNQYSLEKTYAALPLLREAGIVDPMKLSSWELEEVIARLKAAGCDRGPFMTKLFALRLVSLALALNSKGIEGCREVLQSDDCDSIRKLLLPVNGVGPKVLFNFFLLRGIEEDELEDIDSRIQRTGSSQLGGERD